MYVCGWGNRGKMNIKVNRTCGICHTIANTFSIRLQVKYIFNQDHSDVSSSVPFHLNLYSLGRKENEALPLTARLYFSISRIQPCSYLTWCPSFQSNNSVAVLKIYADNCWKNDFGLRVLCMLTCTCITRQELHKTFAECIYCVCCSILSMKHGRSLMKRCILAQETQ